MTSHEHTAQCAARSRYRQLNVTVTEGVDGIASVRMRVKPLQDCWTDAHTVYHSRAANLPSGAGLDVLLSELAELIWEVSEFYRPAE